MGLKLVPLLASLSLVVLLSGSVVAQERVPITAEACDPCPVVTCAPAPCVRVLPSVCEVFKRRVHYPLCIERPPLLSRLHRDSSCVPSGLGFPQGNTGYSQGVPSIPNQGNAQSTPSTPAPAPPVAQAAPVQHFAQAAAPSVVSVPVQSFMMVPVTTWQTVPVTTYQTVSANSVLAQSFNGVQTAGGQSFGSSASALAELETRLLQVIRASGGAASAQSAGTPPCAKTQAELDKRFLELEKRLTDLQGEASKVLIKHDSQLGKHDSQLEEIKKTLTVLLKAGEDQKTRIEKLEKRTPSPEPMKKPDGLPAIPMPESK